MNIDPKGKALILLFLAALIILLLNLFRKKSLRAEYFFWWLFGIIIAGFLVTADTVVSRLTSLVGANLEISFLILCSLFFITCSLVLITMRLSRVQEQMKELVQNIALSDSDKPRENE